VTIRPGFAPFLPARLLRALLFAAASDGLNAQLVPTVPEIRRALPPDSFSAPAYFPQPSPRVLRAIPMGKQQQANPAQDPVAGHDSQDKGHPADPMTTGHAGESIRLAPSESGSQESLLAAQLNLADGLFNRKQTEAAALEYEKFLLLAKPGMPGREQALFRLGECHRMNGNPSAEGIFQRLLEEFPKGVLVPAASFRMAEIREKRGYLDGAASSFETAAKGAADPSLRVTALYRQALCLAKSGQREQAERLLNELSGIPGENACRLPALLMMAKLASESGNRKKALEYYERVMNTREGGESFAEAALKSAMIQSELGNREASRKLLEKVVSAKDSGRWASVAALGAMRMAAETGRDDTVISLAEKAIAGHSENMPDILLLRATSFRKLGKHGQALADYETLLRDYPGSKAASAASFQRLLSLYATRSPALRDEIDHYLLTATDPSERARAEFLKAEESLGRKDYGEAARLYGVVNVESLPEASRADIPYKQAWCLAQSGDPRKALQILGLFLEKYPTDERAAAALAQQAQLKQQLKDFPGAVADYTLLLERYPKAAERELALQQRALILGQQKDNQGMADSFARLLKEFPKTGAAAQAHYWIGWTAFEDKDYSRAVEELSLSRTMDPKQFGERAGLRILLSQYYQNRPAEAAHTAESLKPELIPTEVCRWLGLRAMETGDTATAERCLAPLVREGMPGSSDPEIQGALARVLSARGKFREAQAPAAASLKLSRDPASRARALLAGAMIQHALKNVREASSMTEEALLLQPEGPLNAEGRILSGDLLLSQGDDSGAAKAYMTVAVLNDDPILTPKALSKAIDAYRRCGNLPEAQKAIEELQKRFPSAPVPSVSKP